MLRLIPCHQVTSGRYVHYSAHLRGADTTPLLATTSTGTINLACSSESPSHGPHVTWSSLPSEEVNELSEVSHSHTGTIGEGGLVRIIILTPKLRCDVE